MLGVYGGYRPQGSIYWYPPVLGEGLYSKKIHTPYRLSPWGSTFWRYSPPAQGGNTTPYPGIGVILLGMLGSQGLYGGGIPYTVGTSPGIYPPGLRVTALRPPSGLPALGKFPPWGTGARRPHPLYTIPRSPSRDGGLPEGRTLTGGRGRAVWL